ncbi:MAG: hypothetical protein KDK76_04990 [Chlamydiia bacterium]|nr:hypothetical protein [Chlamydiia bacterium]
MRKWCLVAFLFVPVFLMGGPLAEFYIGEMKSQMFEEETPEHFGFVFLKRTFAVEKNLFVDHCLISTRDGETLEFLQQSELTEDLHKIILSEPQGLVSGTGELIGFPWHWTSLQEKMKLNIESPVEVDINNIMEGETMFSIASVFTLEGDGTREYFGKFITKLYQIDIKTIEKFFTEKLPLDEQ